MCGYFSSPRSRRTIPDSGKLEGCPAPLIRLAQLEKAPPPGEQQVIEALPRRGAHREDAKGIRRVDRGRLRLSQQVHLAEHDTVRLLRELAGVGRHLAAQLVV